MENKHNFMGIIIPVVIAVILLTVLPIINSMNVECPPCEEMPTLYTPTISISGDTLTITPNTNNGAFVTGYNIYVDDVLLDTTTSATYNLSDKLTEMDTYEIYVTAYATKFTNSEPSNVAEYVIEPEPTGPKAFEVGDVLPATTQLKITFIIDYDCPDGYVSSPHDCVSFIVVWDFEFIYDYDYEEYVLDDTTSYVLIMGEDFSIYEDSVVIIDTSSWSLAERTIDDILIADNVLWEDLNA